MIQTFNSFLSFSSPHGSSTLNELSPSGLSIHPSSISYPFASTYLLLNPEQNLLISPRDITGVAVYPRHKLVHTSHYSMPGNNDAVARTNPPTHRIDVDLGEAKRGHVGETLFTEGLATCVAIVVLSLDGKGSYWDKALAHISSAMYGTGDHPHMDEQLNRLFKLDDIPNPEVLVIVAPRNGNPTQAAFNDYIADACRGNWGSEAVKVIIRDQSRLHERGGSRLWIDGEKRVFWGAGGEQIA